MAARSLAPWECGCRGLVLPWHAWLWLPPAGASPTDLTLVGELASSVAGWALG